MSALLTIGDFSRLTHVSVKVLRHYHDVGLLAPTQIDQATGYRFYVAAQAPTAQLIRRFRDMDMPLDQMKAELAAPNADERDRMIVTHLRTMERQLEQAQATVASLRALPGRAGPPPDIELRTLDLTPALVVSACVAWDDTETWPQGAFGELRCRLGDDGLIRAASDGALYGEEFFEEHLGEVTAFHPDQRILTRIDRTGGWSDGGEGAPRPLRRTRPGLCHSRHRCRRTRDRFRRPRARELPRERPRHHRRDSTGHRGVLADHSTPDNPRIRDPEN